MLSLRNVHVHIAKLHILQGVDLEVKESKSLGKMLVVTSEATYTHQESGDVYFRTRSQMIAY